MGRLVVAGWMTQLVILAVFDGDDWDARWLRRVATTSTEGVWNRARSGVVSGRGLAPDGSGRLWRFRRRLGPEVRGGGAGPAQEWSALDHRARDVRVQGRPDTPRFGGDQPGRHVPAHDPR